MRAAGNAGNKGLGGAPGEGADRPRQGRSRARVGDGPALLGDLIAESQYRRAVWPRRLADARRIVEERAGDNHLSLGQVCVCRELLRWLEAFERCVGVL